MSQTKHQNSLRKGVRGYIFSRPFCGQRVPQHVQNLVIRDYCQRKQVFFLLSAVEYTMPGCHMMLEQVMNEMVNIDGLVCYSLFQLPENQVYRRQIYQRIIAQGTSLHFAVENAAIHTLRDAMKIEEIWLISKTLPKCVRL